MEGVFGVRHWSVLAELFNLHRSFLTSPCAKVCNLCPLRRHRAAYLLSKDTMFSRLETDPKRVQNTSHLDGYYPVPRYYCAFHSYTRYKVLHTGRQPLYLRLTLSESVQDIIDQIPGTSQTRSWAQARLAPGYKLDSLPGTS
jgi:hypothetical protein